MFEGLKKKLSDAVKGFVKKEEKEIKEEAQNETDAAQLLVLEKEAEQQAPATAKPEPVQSPNAVQAHEPSHTVGQKTAHSVKPEARANLPNAADNAAEKPYSPAAKQDDIKLSLKTKLKSVFTNSVTLNEKEIEDFAEEIRLSLLQSDVSYDAAEAFIAALKAGLSTTKIDAKNIPQALLHHVRAALFDILGGAGEGTDINALVAERIAHGNTPVKILFLGPNGTGKTTTIAKLAYNFKGRGISSVLSASDTFRAAAIEQTEHHANKVGVPVIKSKYGADPASIAFDAIAYARAHSIQVVLIDSAGRQETNKNLINEMQKITKVATPDLIVFVGESTAGNSLSEQIKEFGKFIKIDGIILTKLDCDAKGGNAISIAYTTGIPLLFLGTGESYDALVPYTPEFIVDSILPNN